MKGYEDEAADWMEEALLSDPDWGRKLDPVESRYIDLGGKGRRGGKLETARKWEMMFRSDGPVSHFYQDANGVIHRLIAGTGGLTEQTYDLLELRLEEYYASR